MIELLDANSVREFAEEAREHIVALNRDLLELEERGADADSELVNEAFRAIHIVRGLSGMLGLGSINELAHKMEDVLASVRQGEAAVLPHENHGCADWGSSLASDPGPHLNALGSEDREPSDSSMSPEFK